MLNANVFVRDKDRTLLAHGFTTLRMIAGEGWPTGGKVSCDVLRKGNAARVEVHIPLLDIMIPIPLEENSAGGYLNTGEFYVVTPPANQPLIRLTANVPTTNI